MSNMIKAYSVRYDDEAKKTIDTHLKIDRDIEHQKSIMIQAKAVMQDGFVEGLKALVVEAIPEEPTNEEMKEKASNMIEEAKAEATLILDQAKKDAEKLKADTISAAQKKGYEEGMLQVKKEAGKLKAEYEEKFSRLEEEYVSMAKTLEPQMVDIIAALVEKMTGILVADKEDVILYLVKKAMKNMDKSDEYTLRVSKEDYDYISANKQRIIETLDREVVLYINEDMGLEKNQCLIETELKIINCSLDVQLNNLITDLKLLSSI